MVPWSHGSHGFHGSHGSHGPKFGAPILGPKFGPKFRVPDFGPGFGLPLQFGSPHPKMVLGHNLQHMAPFGATTNGFYMVFQPATLIFSSLDPIFGAPGPGLGARRPGPPFGAKNGGLKNMILWRDWSPPRFDRIFQEGNGFHDTWEPFGCTNFPPNPPREVFYRDSPQTRKFQQAPLGAWWVPYWPFKGAIACFATCSPV